MAWWRPMPAVYVRRRACLPGTAVHASPCLRGRASVPALDSASGDLAGAAARGETYASRDPAAHQLHAQSAEVAEAIDLAQDFVTLVRQRQPTQLDLWLTRATTSTIEALRRFATGLYEDYEAVKAGVTLPWSSGPVEGHINRLKMLKRQMFGRAHLDLLSRRFLQAPRGPGHRPGSQHPAHPEPAAASPETGRGMAAHDAWRASTMSRQARAWLAIARLSRPMACPQRRLSREGSTCPLQRTGHALHTLSLSTITKMAPEPILLENARSCPVASSITSNAHRLAVFPRSPP